MDKNHIIAKRLGIGVNADAEAIGALDAAGVEFVAVGNHNWADKYPDRPDVKVRVAHDGRNIIVNFRVRETSVRAMAKNQNDPVWHDSCCEFFFQPDLSIPDYYNIECNCAGIALCGYGAPSNDRARFTAEELAAIGRYTTIGCGVFDSRPAPCQWDMVMVIPAEIYHRHGFELQSGLTAGCNFYKCGDELPAPHFMSWNPLRPGVTTFHSPADFGQITFE